MFIFKSFFVLYNVVFLLLLNQKRAKLQIRAWAYDAFLMGKDSISWTEQYIDFI